MVAEAGAAVAANQAASTETEHAAEKPARWMSSYMLAGEVEYALADGAPPAKEEGALVAAVAAAPALPRRGAEGGAAEGDMYAGDGGDGSDGGGGGVGGGGGGGGGGRGGGPDYHPPERTDHRGFRALPEEAAAPQHVPSSARHLPSSSRRSSIDSQVGLGLGRRVRVRA